MTYRYMFLAALVAAGTAQAQLPDRFTLQTFTVDVVTSNRNGVVTNAEEAAFKLDSRAGRIWRLEPKGFVEVVGRKGLDTTPKQAGFVDIDGRNVWALNPDGFAAVIVGAGETPQEKEAVLDRLEGIIIPEIDFRHVDISNAVYFLQKEVRRLDPRTAVDSNDYVRLTLAQTTTNPISIFAGWRFVSARDALLNVSAMAECCLHVRGNNVFVDSAVPPQTLLKVYRVKPSMMGSLSVTNLLRDLSELGYNTPNIASLRYLPESDQLEVRTTREQHAHIETLLESHGAIVPVAARYRLTARTTASRHELALFEIATGGTWMYQALVGADSVRVERFSEMPVAPPFSPPVRAQEVGSFLVSTCTVDAVSVSTANATIRTERAAFKLDTQLGLVWRVEKDAFVLVNGGGRQAAERERMRAVLDKIILPEVHFQNATIIDVMTFFETAARRESNVAVKPGETTTTVRSTPATEDTFVAGDSGTNGTITFSARNISLWQALVDVADLAGCVVLIDKGKLVMKPIGEDEGAPWTRCYGVVSPQTNALGRETITNYFAKLGFRPSKGGRLTYLPELQLVALTDRWFMHDAFMEVLRSGGLVPSGSGRWRLVPQRLDGNNLLFLQDLAYGGTWLWSMDKVS